LAVPVGECERVVVRGIKQALGDLSQHVLKEITGEHNFSRLASKIVIIYSDFDGAFSK
jgi:hypothetical protein